MPERSLIGANNEKKKLLLIRIWTDDEIHGHSLLMMQNPASPCKKTKTQSDHRYKLLSLSKMEYFVPKIAKILSSCNDLKNSIPRSVLKA